MELVHAEVVVVVARLVPARSAATPDWEARRWSEATIPRGARDSGQRVEVMNVTPHPRGEKGESENPFPAKGRRRQG
jgi:hypothetical protein